MLMNTYKGWFQIAFERDLRQGMNRIDLPDQSVLVLKGPKDIRTFQASCPHRGANICSGKLVRDEFVICPFHGCEIGLVLPGKEGFMAKQYRSAIYGGLVFINMHDSNDNGFPTFMADLDSNCFIVPGFQLKCNARPELVIENAFDQMHFRTVHSILNEPVFHACESPAGSYGVKSAFDFPPSKWHKTGSSATLSIPYKAIAFSPYLVVSVLEGESPYYIITSAVPGKEETTIRLSIAVPAGSDRIPPRNDLCQYLLDQSKKGLELDKKIWEDLDRQSTQRFLDSDRSVTGFLQFCKRHI